MRIAGFAFVLAMSAFGVCAVAVAETETPQTCGGLIGAPCEADGTYCHHEAGECRMPDHQGVCKPMPEVCPKISDPVCGCDDVTYGNACEANAAGTSVAAEGACE